MNFVTTPLQYEFFVHGLIAASLVGGICGLIGVYIVLRRMSYIGHGLSHAVFGGAVVSTVMKWNFYLGAGLWGFFSVLLINYVSGKKKIGADAAIGVITTASFAVGVAIISQYRRFTKNFEAALFGNILGVTSEDLWMIAIVALISALLISAFYRQLLFTTFDADVARVYGIPVGWTEGLFSLILAAVIIVSMQIMGVTMIAAAIVIPAVVARLITDSFNKIVFLSVLIGVLSGIFGMYFSFYLNVSSGATIVLTGAVIFIITYVIQLLKERSVLPKAGTRPVLPETVPTHQHPHEHAGFFHVHEHANHEENSSEKS
ncbi:MAG: metal ABC transporter permease [Nitrospiria bacterium]